MDKLKQLLSDLDACDASLDALLDHDELTDAQRAEHDRLQAERKKLLASVARQKERATRDEERARLTAETEAAELAAEERASRTVSPGRRTSADEPTPQKPPTRVRVKDPDFTVDPKKGFKTPREFLTSVMQAGRGHPRDRRLELLYQPDQQMAAGSDEARGISDPAGGFLIPEGFSPNLFQLQPEDDPTAGRTTMVPMQNPIVRWPARVDKNHSTSVSGGLTVTRRPETVSGTSSQQTFERVALETNTLFGLSYATEEILTDSPISFIAIIEAGFSQQFTYHLINERINGTGVGEFQGIMSASNGSLISVAAETDQVGATILKENIDKMRSRCWGYQNAIWMANHDTLPQLRSLVQVVGVGGAPVGYVSMDVNGNATLDGRPLYMTEYCATLGTTGDLMLCNWSQYLEGIYQPMQQAESIHVRFLNHERAFKFWIRNAGACWWKSALTPKNSSSTLSPFVVLATRS